MIGGLSLNLKLMFLILILVFFIMSKSSEICHGYVYGWIPISTRNTYNMSYDIRGEPKITIISYPYRTKEWLGPYFYNLFPKWFISSRHPLA